MNVWWKKISNSNIGLFLICFIQVNLVTINIYQVAEHKWAGMAMMGFLISFMWSLNVTAVVFGSLKQRFIYALGGSAGCLTGGLITSYFY